MDGRTVVLHLVIHLRILVDSMIGKFDSSLQSKASPNHNISTSMLHTWFSWKAVLNVASNDQRLYSKGNNLCIQFLSLALFHLTLNTIHEVQSLYSLFLSVHRVCCRSSDDILGILGAYCCIFWNFRVNLPGQQDLYTGVLLIYFRKCFDIYLAVFVTSLGLH